VRNDGKKRVVVGSAVEKAKTTASKEDFISQTRADEAWMWLMVSSTLERLITHWCGAKDLGAVFRFLIEASAHSKAREDFLDLQSVIRRAPYDDVSVFDEERKAVTSKEEYARHTEASRAEFANELLRACEQIMGLSPEGARPTVTEVEKWLLMSRREQDEAYTAKRKSVDQYGRATGEPVRLDEMSYGPPMISRDAYDAMSGALSRRSR
jgi:hypothetical protein